MPQAAELLSEGRAKHDRGDRMGAVMMYEKALKKVSCLSTFISDIRSSQHHMQVVGAVQMVDAALC